MIFISNENLGKTHRCQRAQLTYIYVCASVQSNPNITNHLGEAKNSLYAGFALSG